MSCKLLLSAAASLLLAACVTQPAYKNIGEEDPFVGEAVRYNAALHIINPDPVYPEGAAEPGDSGAKGAAAVKRYRNDEVNQRHRRDSRVTGQSTTSGPQ
jgi:hypothetical protein